MEKILEFKKKGDTFTVLMKDGNLFLEMRGARDVAEARHYPQHGWGYAIRMGNINRLLTGKSDKPVVILHESAERAAQIVKEWKEKKAVEEEAKRQRNIERLKSGEKPILVRWHDGEYLSGYEVLDMEAAQLLREIGLAKYVTGWGYLVEDELVRTLGKRFTYSQAVEFARPRIEEKERKEAEARRKREEEEARLRPMSAEREAQYRVEVGPISRVDGGEGPDYVCEIVTISPERKRMKFYARNIFDFGLVINPEAGGVAVRKNDGKMYWSRMDGDVEMTQEEIEHYWVAQKNVPAALRGIRM